LGALLDLRKLALHEPYQAEELVRQKVALALAARFGLGDRFFQDGLDALPQRCFWLLRSLQDSLELEQGIEREAFRKLEVPSELLQRFCIRAGDLRVDGEGSKAAAFDLYLNLDAPAGELFF
jgi:hypothetical protein